MKPTVKKDGRWRTVISGYRRVNGRWRAFYKRVVGINSLATWWDFDRNLNDYVNNTLASKGSTTDYGEVDGKVGLRVYGGHHGLIPSFQLGTSWTISLWYYPVALTTYSHLLTNTANQSNLAIKLAVGRPYLHSGGIGSRMAVKSIPAGKWSMLTFTYTPGSFKIYIDGVLDVTYVITFNLPTGAAYIGRGHESEFSNGYQRDVMRYTRPLTAEEIAELYRQQS